MLIVTNDSGISDDRSHPPVARSDIPQSADYANRRPVVYVLRDLSRHVIRLRVRTARFVTTCPTPLSGSVAIPPSFCLKRR
ncbi:hypothetical protein KCP69_03725 [Salmonella enterica subsp. enterica]|nr:hypothetical protein KCP69_03725 [Salmonella enterica subsp. enterica]